MLDLNQQFTELAEAHAVARVTGKKLRGQGK
jgi:hypothetical protein